jgi:hypothetical protein
MDRPLTLVIILAVLSGAMAFLGTLLSAPGQIDRRAYGQQVRTAMASGEWPRVREESRRALRQDSRFQEALLFLGMAEDRVGDARRARSAWTRLERISRENIARGNDSPEQLHFLGWALSGQGDDAGARAAWRDLVETMGDPNPYDRVCYLALAGDTEAALVEWERLMRRPRDPTLMAWSRVDPDLDGIRNDPRFEAARRRSGDEYRVPAGPPTAF